MHALEKPIEGARSKLFDVRESAVLELILPFIYNLFSRETVFYAKTINHHTPRRLLKVRPQEESYLDMSHENTKEKRCYIFL